MASMDSHVMHRVVSIVIFGTIGIGKICYIRKSVVGALIIPTVKS